MTWLYALLEPTAIGNRLALLIAGLRAIGGLGFVFLSAIFFVTQGIYRSDPFGSGDLGLGRSNNASDRLCVRALFVAHRRPHSSSASRFTAGASGFLNLSHPASDLPVARIGQN